MAEYLRTSSIYSTLDNLIRNTKKKLYLISPYLDLSDNIQKVLKSKNAENIEIVIIYGKERKLKVHVLSFLNSLNNLKLLFVENLHAKCYLNEDTMIIASMNLFEYSHQNNEEMGVLIDKEKDKSIYEEACKDIKIIEKDSVLIKDFSKQNKQKTGYCIRTGIEIPFNIDKPMCAEAFKSWNKFANPDYPEKYCHFSGELSKGETTISKPILSKNWKKAQSVFNF